MSLTRRLRRLPGARPFFVNPFSADRVRPRRRSLTFAVLAPLLALGLVAAGFAAPATAAVPTTMKVTGVASCQSDGTYSVTWTYAQTTAPTGEAEVTVTNHAAGTRLDGVDAPLLINTVTQNSAAHPGVPTRTGSWSQTFTQTGIPQSATNATIVVNTLFGIGGYSIDTTGRTATGGCTGTAIPLAPTVTTVTACGIDPSVSPVPVAGVSYAVDFDRATGAYTVTATPESGFHFTGAQSVTYTGNVGVAYDCILAPEASVTFGACYPNDGFSSKNVYVLLDNSASNTAVTFTASGLNATVAAGEQRQVEVSPIWNQGGQLDISVAGRTISLVLPAFADCGAVIAPSSSAAGGACTYADGTTTGAHATTITFDNSASNRPVAFAVAGYPQYDRLVAAGAVVTVGTAAETPTGRSYTVTAGDYSRSFTVDECPTLVPATPRAIIAATCGAATVSISNDFTPTSRTVGQDVTASIRVDNVIVDVVVVHPSASARSVDSTYTFPEASGDHLVEVLVDGKAIAARTVTTDCALVVFADPSAQSCVDGVPGNGLIYVAYNDLVVYRIDGVIATQAYTAAGPGSHVVTAVLADPNSGYTLAGQTEFRDEVFVDPNVDCVSISSESTTSVGGSTTAVASTLAYTGVDGRETLVGLLAGLMLLLSGSAIIIVRRVRRNH